MSTIERAVLKGTLGDVVQIRNIFTAEITEVGADTSELLWDVYIDALMGEVVNLLAPITHFSGYDVYQLQAGQWVLLDEVTLNVTGAGSSEPLLNQAAVVLIGKAAGVRHMGRKFFGALNEYDVVGNSLITTAAAGFAALLLAYISPVTGIGGGTLQPGTVDVNGGFWPFVGGTVSSLLGTMRRRKPGNGI
jgi:hypothetical protein